MHRPLHNQQTPAEELDEALLQIAEIRQRMAQGQTYRGYRSATALFSAVLAPGGGSRSAPVAGDDVWTGVLVWVSRRGREHGVVGTEMFVRYRRTDSTLQREMTLVAAEQFAPAAGGGGLAGVRDHGLLPGAAGDAAGAVGGAVLDGGLRVAPGAAAGDRGGGGVLLLAGVAGLALEGRVPFGWRMAMAFVPGQLLAAFVLYWNLERRTCRSVRRTARGRRGGARCRRRAGRAAPSGRYAYEGLHRVIHERRG